MIGFAKINNIMCEREVKCISQGNAEYSLPIIVIN